MMFLTLITIMLLIDSVICFCSFDTSTKILFILKAHEEPLRSYEWPMIESFLGDVIQWKTLI